MRRVGLPPGATETTVKLMIFDSSTKFDPFARGDLAGPYDLTHRALPWHFPELDLSNVSLANYAGAELSAKLFAAAPHELFVYAKLDLDADIATLHHPVADKVFPKKNEPLLVLSAGGRVRVLAQDGTELDVKATHVTLDPDGAPAPIAAPRKLDPKLALGDVMQLLPASDKGLVASYDGSLCW